MDADNNSFTFHRRRTYGKYKYFLGEDVAAAVAWLKDYIDELIDEKGIVTHAILGAIDAAFPDVVKS